MRFHTDVSIEPESTPWTRQYGIVSTAVQPDNNTWTSADDADAVERYARADEVMGSSLMFEGAPVMVVVHFFGDGAA